MSAEKVFHDLASFTLPAEIGRVETHTLSCAGCSGVVAFVSNHGLTNLSGIRNAAEIIRSIATAFDMEAIFVDGAAGAAEFSVWDYMHPLMREWFTEKLMLKGYISPAERAIVLYPELKTELFGIDDRDFYKANWRAAQDLKRKQKDAVDGLRSFQKELSEATGVLSVDTRELVERQDAYEIARQLWSKKPGGQDQAEEAAMREARSRWFSSLHLGLRWLGVPIPQWLAREMQRFGLSLDEPFSAADDDAFLSVTSFLREASEESVILSHLSADLAQDFARTETDRAFLFLRRAASMLIPAVNRGMGIEEATEFLQAFYTGTAELRRSLAVVANALEKVGQSTKLELPEDIDSLVRTVVEYNSFAMLRGVKMAHNIAGEMTRRGIDRAIVVQSGFQYPLIAGILSRDYGIVAVQFFPKAEGREGAEAYDARLLAEGDDDEKPTKDPKDSGRVEDVSKAPVWLQNLQAEANEEWERRALGQYSEDLISRCRRDYRTILVADCGDGETFLKVAGHCRSAFIVGLDNYRTNLIPSNRMPTFLQWQIRYERLERRTILVNSLSRFPPFLDGTFDLVVTDAIDRIFNAGECRTALREFIRVLKPGGDLRLLTCRWVGVVKDFLARGALADTEMFPIHSGDAPPELSLFVGSRPQSGETL
jgi:SAM-dependent methyltransferase